MQPLYGRRVLLGITAGIAAYKAAELARLLIRDGAEVQVVMTVSASEFIGPMTLQAITGRPVRDNLFDPQHEAVLISDYLRRGQTIQFHVRDGQAASEDLEALLERERKQYRNGNPCGGLIFSCNGRGTRLFERPDHDVSAVRDALGSIADSLMALLANYGVNVVSGIRRVKNRYRRARTTAIPAVPGVARIAPTL